jgi:hypothetical protein
MDRPRLVVLRGRSGDSRAHSHLCAQVVVGMSGPARVETEHGLVEAPVVAVAPGVRHGCWKPTVRCG